MEINTRLQVEHPVTEMVTNFDLVREQILVAAGKKLSITQDKVKIAGHAIECRINAEDPDNDFRPSPGKIVDWIIPGGPGTRIESAGFSGWSIPPYYDSMIAKFIAHGKDRQDAIQIMLRMLKETKIGPIKTTIPIHEKILNRPKFREGGVTTDFIAKYLEPGSGTTKEKTS